MLHFNIKDGQVVLDADNLSLNSVKSIYKEYSPELAIKILSYIHVVARLDPTAPFFSADVKEIKDLAMKQYFSDEEVKLLNWKQINMWKTRYEKAYESPEVRIVKIFNDKIDQIRELIKNTKPEIKSYESSSGTKGFASNTAIITKTMNDVDSLLDAKDKLEARVRKQNVKQGRIMGGKTPSRLEAAHIKNS